jgi:hypothetical protein
LIKRAYRYISDIPSLDTVQPPFLFGTTTLNSAYWELASNYVYSNITNQLLDVIKYPPIYAPIVNYNADQGQRVNKLRNYLFQFSARFRYINKEKSVWSDISEIPLPTTPEEMNGAYDETVVRDNVIDVNVSIGTNEVDLIEIAVRELNTGLWRIIAQIYKYDENGNLVIPTIADSYTYHFYNNEVGIPLASGDVERLQDFVPQIASTQDIIEKTRLLYGNYTEGFDNLNIDVKLIPQSRVAPLTLNGASVGVFDSFSTKRVQWAFSQISWGLPPYHVAVVDFQPFFQTGYTYTVNVSAPNYKYNTYTGGYGTYPDYPIENEGDTIEAIASTYATDSDTIDTVLDRLCFQLRQGNGTNESALAVTWPGGTSYPCPYRPYAHWYALQGTSQDGFQITGEMTSKYWMGIVINAYEESYNSGLVSISVTKSTQFYKFPTFISGANHPFGIIYYDRTGSRCGAIQTSVQSNVYIPAQTEILPQHNLLQNYIEWQVNNKPPMGAEYWSWAYAKNTSEEYVLWASLDDIGVASGLGVTDQQLYFTINKPINLTAEYNSKFNVEPYEWERGDRIRFLFYEDAPGDWKTISSVIDFEILGQQLPNDDTAYEKDRTSTPSNPVYITDADGNKVPDNSQYKFIIQNFNYSYYNILIHKTIVEIYRPRKQTLDLVWYQYGNKHPVINPNTNNRYHAGGNGTDILSVAYQQNQNAHQPAKGKHRQTQYTNKGFTT